jgi:hypothetical protein
MRLPILVRLAMAWAWLAHFAGCDTSPRFPPASFARAIPWAEQGVWLKADTHVHTKFSDGNVELGRVVDQAANFGCNVIAITDHADTGLSGTSEEYFIALAQARRENPGLVLLAGMEWNVPPWQGREHACVLVPPGVHERKLLREFQVLFDDFQRPARDPLLAVNALHWLKENSYGIGGLPVVFYNHPNRKRDASAEFPNEYASWQIGHEIAVGFEGGPGHQESDPIGAYSQSRPTIDRWDPAVANVGDAWDQLLQQGIPAWGALATSDFHANAPDQRDDFWPGEFSETWLYAADDSPKGALDALRCGSFFGSHGHIARNVELKVWTANIARPAVAGEAIRVPPNTTVEVALELKVPKKDYQGQANHIDEIEFIAITSSGAKTVYQQRPLPAERAAHFSLPVGAGGVTIRARGRRILADNPDLLFYTNPIQVFTYGLTAAAASKGSVAVKTSSLSSNGTASSSRMFIPSVILLALVGCGGVLIALIDQWRIEAIRRFAGSKANGPLPHTKAHASVRLPLGFLNVFVFVAIMLSLSPFRFEFSGFEDAAVRWWALLKGPLRIESARNAAGILLLFLPIGFAGTWILLGRQPSDRRRMAALPMIVACCVALSGFLEFAQQALSANPLLQANTLVASFGGLVGGASCVWILALRRRSSRRRVSTTRGSV